MGNKNENKNWFPWKPNLFMTTVQRLAIHIVRFVHGTINPSYVTAPKCPVPDRLSNIAITASAGQTHTFTHIHTHTPRTHSHTYTHTTHTPHAHIHTHTPRTHSHTYTHTPRTHSHTYTHTPHAHTHTYAHTHTHSHTTCIVDPSSELLPA